MFHLRRDAPRVSTLCGGRWYAAAGEHQKKLDFYDRSIAELAASPPRRMSIKELIHFGDRPTEARQIRSANYIRKEIPVRLAHRIYDLYNLPHIVMKNPDLQRVMERYIYSLAAFREIPNITTAEENRTFRDFVAHHINLHMPAVDELRRGVADCRRIAPHVSMSGVIDRMLVTRISRRVIAEFYLSLHQQREGYAGIVNMSCSPHNIIERTGKGAAKLCTDRYGRAPKLRIEGDISSSLAYFDTHLEYIFFEVLKNSMRAVAEHHARADHLPDLLAVIVDGDEILSVKITDQGGGVHPSGLENIWRYGYSDAHEYQRTTDDTSGMDNLLMGAGQIAEENNPMCGMGFGLPMSRIYARYVGGDLDLYSVYGYGTDVVLRLNRLGDHMESREI